MTSKLLKTRQFKTRNFCNLIESVNVECQTDFYDVVLAKNLYEIETKKAISLQENELII